MKILIVNADDFGYTSGVNEGIIKAHSKGIVTSTSLMVYGKRASEATILSKYKNLSVGLHFQLTEKKLESYVRASKTLSTVSTEKISEEFGRQLNEFINIMGKKPTHLDSHHHVHMHPMIKPIFEKYSKENKIPVRDFYGVGFIDNFFGWNEAKMRDINNIGVNALLKILARLDDGVYELMCHPGVADKKLIGSSSYAIEREEELKTLTDKKIFDFVSSSGIKLVNWTKAYSYVV